MNYTRFFPFAFPSQDRECLEVVLLHDVAGGLALLVEPLVGRVNLQNSPQLANGESPAE